MIVLLCFLVNLIILYTGVMGQAFLYVKKFTKQELDYQRSLWGTIRVDWSICCYVHRVPVNSNHDHKKTGNEKILSLFYQKIPFIIVGKAFLYKFW